MRVLVLGGTGMIGHRMWATLGSLGHDVYGVCRSDLSDHLKNIPGINIDKSFIGVDVTDYKRLDEIVDSVKPEMVLNCVGIVKQLPISKNSVVSIEMNALFPHKLAELCKKHNSRMIQFSTDCVFSGKKGQYTENDFTDVDDLYGKSKILGEVISEEHVLTMRTSTIGREIRPHGGLVEWFLSENGNKVKGFSKAMYSGFPTHTLAKIIDKYILPNKISGLYHISSAAIDKYNLLVKIKNELSLDIEIAEDDNFEMERSLNSSKFQKETGMEQMNWDQIISDLKIDEEFYNSLER